jgi:hypothetical protein
MPDRTNTQTASSKTPSHMVYHVPDRAGRVSFCTRIGAAWARAHASGFDIQHRAMKKLLDFRTQRNTLPRVAGTSSSSAAAKTPLGF